MCLFQSQNILDILGDVSTPSQPMEPPTKSGVSDLLDILGDVANVTSAPGRSFVKNVWI